MRGVVHWEFLPEGTTITKEYYYDQLDWLREKLQGEQDRVYFLQDDAKPHIAKVTCRKLLDFG